MKFLYGSHPSWIWNDVLLMKSQFYLSTYIKCLQIFSIIKDIYSSVLFHLEGNKTLSCKNCTKEYFCEVFTWSPNICWSIYIDGKRPKAHTSPINLTTKLSLNNYLIRTLTGQLQPLIPTPSLSSSLQRC